MSIDSQEVIQALPFLEAEIEALSSKTVDSQTALHVCLVGAFSTGKSSLINALLAETLLPTAREESTALPTFIEYADERRVELVNNDGHCFEISQAEFAHHTVQAPEGALCSRLYCNAAWLQGLTLVDLPGLGSTSARHRDYTHAQISAADVVIYLLSSRGVSQEDLALLNVIQSNRKSVMVVVGHWDQVEESIKEGEQEPDLIEWSTQILQATSLDVDLLGVSKLGHGRDEVLHFLQTVRLQRQQIRQQRFMAELSPILQTALHDLELKKKTSSAQSEAEKRALQSELMAQREALLTLKKNLYAESNADQKQLKKQAEQVAVQQNAELSEQLSGLPPLVNESEWALFIESAHQALQAQIQSLATALEALSNNYGSLALHVDEVKKLDLQLPLPEKMEASDFIDAGRLANLQAELGSKEEQAESEKKKIGELSGGDVDGVHRELLELQKEQRTVSQKELPRIVQEIEGSKAGSSLGKVVGQLLDVGLIVVAPLFAASKGAAVVSTGAKVLKAANTAGKAAQVMNSSGLKPVMKFSEKLSLSYWGEQVGRSFDKPPERLEMIDPEAQAEQQRILNECKQKISGQKRELARLEVLKQQRDYSEWALEQNLKDQQRLRKSLEEVERGARESQAEAQKEAEVHKKQVWLNYRQQVVNQNVNALEKQARSMTALLNETCKLHWKDRVEGAIKDKIDLVGELSQKMSDSPEKKKADLAVFQNDIAKVEAVLAEIK